MQNCEICEALNDEKYAGDIIFQTERWRVSLHRNQSYLGKSFITLREHKETLSDLDATDWAELHEVIRRMEHAVKKSFGADVCNWECLMNNAVKARQPTHVHWHMHPRYLQDVVFAGETFTDQKWPRIAENANHEVRKKVFGEILKTLQNEVN